MARLICSLKGERVLYGGTATQNFTFFVMGNFMLNQKQDKFKLLIK